ncbi:MAG: hypothetical protein JRJ19_04115, partial [Deltaproteobacteria bacterium]|nr:hypothetical protein [Deltaproteobacteria bacterium]
AGNPSTDSNQASYEVPLEDCNDLADNDYDGLTDCQDVECSDNPEVCDGFDNDCNNDIDDLTGPDCPLQVGVCAGATQPCGGAAGWLNCNAASYGNDYEANDESTCDGLDNDCDDSTDENIVGPACPLLTGVCTNSRQPCNGAAGFGECDASVYGSDYEADETTCDDLDNDCDGTTDEGCPCTPDDVRACSSDEGECVAGTQTCDQNGAWGECSGVLPTTEVCDGLDNDCDTFTDDDLTGPDCALQEGVCAGAEQACAGASGWQACDASSYGNDYQTEETVCDSLDNDCDGLTDEDDVCGQADGGTDGGVDAGTDAGSGSDNGSTDDLLVKGGCACSTSVDGLPWPLLLVIPFVLRRRRR